MAEGRGAARGGRRRAGGAAARGGNVGSWQAEAGSHSVDYCPQAKSPAREGEANISRTSRPYRRRRAGAAPPPSRRRVASLVRQSAGGEAHGVGWARLVVVQEQECFGSPLFHFGSF